MRSARRVELQVGAFLGLGLALTLIVIWAFGSTQNLFRSQDRFVVSLERVDGISIGAKVTVSGLDAGNVESFSLSEQSRRVKVNLLISKKFDTSIRKDSTVEVLSEGVLGDKQIAITAGNPSSPELPPGSEIRARPEVSIGTVINKSDQLLASLTVLTRDLDQLASGLNEQLKGNHLSNSLREFESILGKVDHGNGAVSGLVNDPELYDDVKALIGESNGNRIVRNIVRQTIKDSEKKPG